RCRGHDRRNSRPCSAPVTARQGCMTAAASEYEVSTDVGRLDLDLIHRFLRDESYWARGIPRAVVEKSVRHSLCFGVFHRGEQVGFARVITDQAVFAYLADVFILPDHRGRGVAKQLMRAIVGDARLQGLRKWALGTRDAHGLYAQFGFGAPSHPEYQMEIDDP